MGHWIVDIPLNNVELEKVFKNIQNLIEEFSIKDVHFIFKN